MGHSAVMILQYLSRSLRTLGLAVLCVSLAACGSREREGDVAARSGILLLGNGSEPKTLDPHLATGVPESDIIRALLEGLVNHHPTNDLLPEPGAAESWESNADFTVWTFKLRADGKWSNGDPVKASDFVYSWQRILSPALGSEYAESLYVISNSEAFHQGGLKDFSQVGVKALDDLTLQVTLKGSTPHFLSMLKHSSFYPVNPAVVEKHGGMTDRQSGWSTMANFVGNGPFKLKEWVTNQIIKTEKNPAYWDAANVRLNEIHFFPIDNVKTEETAYQGGRLHVTSTLSPDKIASFRRSNPGELKIEPYLGTYFYRINVTRAPFNDVRVREALNLAVDRKLLVERVTQGGQAPATGYVPQGLEGYATATTLSFDPVRARALLAEAGFPGGKGFPKKEILINTSESHRKIAEAIQAMWREHLGIEIGIYNQEWKVYLDSQSKLDFDVSRAGWIGDYAYPMTFLDMFTTGNGNNDTGWANPAYDGLIRQAQRAASEQSRMDLMAQAEAVLLKDLPIIPIYWYTKVHLRDPRVKGWGPSLLGKQPYKHMSLDAK